MTLTIAWWLFPVGFVVVGFALAAYFFGRRPRSDFDFVSPLMGAFCGIGGILLALVFCLSRWMA